MPIDLFRTNETWLQPYNFSSNDINDFELMCNENVLLFGDTFHIDSIV